MRITSVSVSLSSTSVFYKFLTRCDWLFRSYIANYRTEPQAQKYLALTMARVNDAERKQTPNFRASG
jgi:hypothetical protein